MVEVFATAWRRREVVPDEALPWLYATAGNVIAHVIRSDSRRTRLGTKLATVRPLHTTEVDPAQQVVDDDRGPRRGVRRPRRPLRVRRRAPAPVGLGAARAGRDRRGPGLLTGHGPHADAPGPGATARGTGAARRQRTRSRRPRVDGPGSPSAAPDETTSPPRHPDHPQRLGGHTMNTQSTEDRADEALRALLAQADPEAGAPQPEPAHLLDRVRAAAAAGEAPAAGAAPGIGERPHLAGRAPVVHPEALAGDAHGGCRRRDPGAGCGKRPARPGRTAAARTRPPASASRTQRVPAKRSAGVDTDKGTAVDGSVGAPEAARDTAVSSEARAPRPATPTQASPARTPPTRPWSAPARSWSAPRTPRQPATSSWRRSWRWAAGSPPSPS